MEITEVRVKLVDGGQDKLRAFCSITIDDAFVVRDLKVIEGNKGLFVAMPSRKLTMRCQRCGYKNQIRSNYCNDCGTTLPPDASQRLEERGKVHADIAHPINTECREHLQARVVESYLEEVDASQQPGYRPREDDDLVEARTPPPPRRESAPRESSRREEPVRGETRREPSRREEPQREEFQRQQPPRGEFRGRQPSPTDRSPVFADGVGDERPAASESRAASESVRPPASPERPSRRPTGAERGPLSEMPPPDDNFSAGIF